MTETLTIDRMIVSSPDDGSDRAARLDRIVRGVAEHRLEQSLGLNSIAPEGEWCIKRIALSAPLDFERPDGSLEEVLAHAVLGAITTAVHGADVVHYPRTVDALADLVSSVSVGRFDRAWAWARVGLIGDPREIERDPASSVLEVLAAHPTNALAALTRALTNTGLAALHRLFTEAGWVRLVDIVIGAHVNHETKGDIEAVIRDGSLNSQVSTDIARASRLICSSQIALAARASRLRLDGRTARSLAVLAVAESEPATLQCIGGAEMCLTVAELVTGTAQSVLETPSTASEHRGPPKRNTDISGDVTPFAGLLFLLNVAQDAAMPSTLFDDPALEPMPPSELLALLAMSLVDVADDDPAVQAFAGCDTQGLRPGWSHQPLAVDLLQRIESHARTWATAAAARLRRDDEDPLDVIAGLARRTGRIEREQGWTEVHLDLADVDVDVRVAGLDVDPGWVPWLGSIVRFCYA